MSWSLVASRLQQHLPPAVLKRTDITSHSLSTICCNNTYRLRYAPQSARQQRSKATMRSAHLKYLNEEKVKQMWPGNSAYRLRYWNNRGVYSFSSCWFLNVATTSTVYGIETHQVCYYQKDRCNRNSTYRLRYWNYTTVTFTVDPGFKLQQHLPPAVCAEGCETTEEQSDYEAKCLSKVKVKQRW